MTSYVVSPLDKMLCPQDILKAEFEDWMMSDVSCWEDSPLVAFVSCVVNHEVVHPYVFR